MIKTFKYKLYNSKKNKHLHRLINIASRVYNHCIALHKGYYRLYKKSLKKYQLQKHITKLKKLDKYKYWNELGSQAIQDITDRIDRAYKLFYKLRKQKIRCSVPTFKSRKKYKSFTLKQAGYKFLYENKVKIGNKVYKYSKDRKIEGKVKTLSVKRDLLGDIYLFVVCETDSNSEYKSMTGKIAGFDFGLKTFLTVSDGTKVKSPEFLKNNIKELKKKSRLLSKKNKGSNNRKRARIELRKLHRNILNKRRDFFFKLAKSLVEQYDYLYFEDLNIKAMQKLWGRKINDLAFSEFLSILKNKALEYRKCVLFIDRFYPSSKTCSKCGYINQELELRHRSWICSECETKHDRDLNASINIMRKGRALSFGEDTISPISDG